MDQTLVGVLGATSIVGRGLLPLLTQGKYQVAAFSRHSSQENGRFDNISWRRMDQLPPLGKSITSWICLTPIWLLPDYFDWLLEYGVKRIVVLSSTSRFTKINSSDLREQATARKFMDSEQRLMDWAESNGITWTVLRPTLIYGLGQDKNVSQIARLIKRFGFFPLLGEARGLRQPIHFQDLAAACVVSLEKTAARNHAFNLSGSEVLSYRDMVIRIFVALDKRPRFVRIPLCLFQLTIAAMRVLPTFRNWSPAMVERMNQDLSFDHSEAERQLGFAPKGFALKKEDLPVF